MDEYVNMLPSFMPFSTVFLQNSLVIVHKRLSRSLHILRSDLDQLIIFWKRRPDCRLGEFGWREFCWNLQRHEKLTEDFQMKLSLWYNASCLPTLIQKLKTVWRTANILIGPGLFPATLHLWHLQQASVFSHMTQGPSDVPMPMHDVMLQLMQCEYAITGRLVVHLWHFDTCDSDD